MQFSNITNQQAISLLVVALATTTTITTAVECFNAFNDCFTQYQQSAEDDTTAVSDDSSSCSSCSCSSSSSLSTQSFLMSYQNPPSSINDDATAGPFVTSSKWTRTTVRSLCMVVAVVAGMMLVAGGAAWMHDDGSYYHSAWSIETVAEGISTTTTNYWDDGYILDDGVFDPKTHLTRDPATGVCRLKFLRLTSTCVGAPASSSGFGVMVEAPLRTGPGTGPGAHTHHEPNEDDKNRKDNSGLLLRFSYDAGATYDNYEDPRNTVPLGSRSSSRRELGTVGMKVASEA